jgi:hypothetical protein
VIFAMDITIIDVFCPTITAVTSYGQRETPPIFENGSVDLKG